MELVTLWAPFDIIEKGDGDTTGRGRIKGIASSEALDADNEIIIQKGLDFSDAKWITLEHPCGVMNIVGEPISFSKSSLNGHSATEIEADLFLTDALGKQIFEKARTLNKANSKSKLGFSIEGRAVRRNGNKIEEAKVHSVAISANPKNPLATFDPVMASMFFRSAMAGYPAQAMGYSAPFAPVVPQSLDGGKDRDKKEDEIQKEAQRRVEALASETYSVNGEIDMMTSALLKKSPMLTWTQGENIVRGILNRLRGRN